MSEAIARSFVGVRAALAAGHGIDVASWDEMDEWARSFLASVFALMLERHEIEKGRRGRPRDALPLPAQVRVDVSDIVRDVAGLAGLYAAAVEGLEGSGAGDGVGGRGLGDVDPTHEHALDSRRRAQRSAVGEAAGKIGQARNELYSARETLRGYVVERGYGQERRDRVRPDRQGALISGADLRESLEAQDRRARGES